MTSSAATSDPVLAEPVTSDPASGHPRERARPETQAPPAFDLDRVRAAFPIFQNGRFDPPLSYLDSAASSQKPEAVLTAMDRFYRGYYSNVHRGIHPIAARTDAAYEAARRKVADWVGAEAPEELVFVRGTTEAINLVARSFLRPRLQAGDEVLVSELEHHANLVPWQIVCEEVGARVVAAPVDDAGNLDIAGLAERLGPRTRMLAITHVSNALGTRVPVKAVTAMAREHGVPVLVDGAQALAHGRVDVAELGCDFYAFSGHKMFGPTGIGGLWGRSQWLREMPPYQGGGAMIRNVEIETSTWADPPARFEAGTPHIAGAIGLGAAIDWLSSVDWEGARRHEDGLVTATVEALEGMNGVRLVGRPDERVGVVSFVVDGAHPHDVGTVLAAEGVAVRAGHHCAQPLMRRFGVPATTRASFALYNGPDDVDALVRGLEQVQQIFGSAP